MAKKKTPPEYGLSPYESVSVLRDKRLASRKENWWVILRLFQGRR